MKKAEQVDTLDDIDIGRHIKVILEEKGVDMVDFARKISCSVSYAYKLLKKKHVDPGILYQICRILDYNFFGIYEETLDIKSQKNGKEEHKTIHVHLDIPIPHEELKKGINVPLCTFCPYGKRN